ncbi:MAG: desulfoferrodoxin [Bacilli bacterium]|jgi:superoxide reductase|nr:desulfoferrodoxin [Bacilli bacterium]
MKFYYCKHCKNIITFVKEVNPNIVCCNEKMVELVPGSVDAAHEKHIPVVDINENKVTVCIGSVEHPMQVEHYIEWIILETTKGVYRKNLNPGEKPEATFVLEEGEKIVSTYEYCNLHGLWVK